jgi:hypothetical protein
MSKMPKNIIFISQTCFLSSILVESLKVLKFHTNTRKVFFPSTSDMGWFRVITNSVQFH